MKKTGEEERHYQRPKEEERVGGASDQSMSCTERTSLFNVGRLLVQSSFASRRCFTSFSRQSLTRSFFLASLPRSLFLAVSQQLCLHADFLSKTTRRRSQQVKNGSSTATVTETACLTCLRQDRLPETKRRTKSRFLIMEMTKMKSWM